MQGVPGQKHMWGVTLACTTQETPEPAHPMDSGQLQIMMEHHLPAPAQLILHGGWRLVVSGLSQSLWLTGLGKSLPLICQQQPRLNYKKRVYLAHTKGAPQIPRLGDSGSCATGPYRTPTTLGHTTKTQSQNSSTKYIDTNTGRLWKWEDKETWPKGKNRSKLQKKSYMQWR